MRRYRFVVFVHEWIVYYSLSQHDREQTLIVSILAGPAIKSRLTYINRHGHSSSSIQVYSRIWIRSLFNQLFAARLLQKYGFSCWIKNRGNSNECWILNLPNFYLYSLTASDFDEHQKYKKEQEIKCIRCSSTAATLCNTSSPSSVLIGRARFTIRVCVCVPAAVVIFFFLRQCVSNVRNARTHVPSSFTRSVTYHKFVCMCILFNRQRTR